MKCKYEKSCGYEVCVPEYCSDFEEATVTNGDRIRAMTDKELAEFLAKKFTGNEAVKAASKGDLLTATYLSEISHTWFKVWMQWLRQPAEVPEYA